MEAPQLWLFPEHPLVLFLFELLSCCSYGVWRGFSVSCEKSVKCVCEGSSLYLSPFELLHSRIQRHKGSMIYSLLLLFSGSPCCTWTATSAWTCRRRKTRWFPPSETATTAARSSGCSVTWPWASEPHLSPAAGALVLNDPASPHHRRVALTSVSTSAWTGYRDWSRWFCSIMRLFPFIAAAAGRSAVVSQTSFSYERCAYREHHYSQPALLRLLLGCC